MESILPQWASNSTVKKKKNWRIGRKPIGKTFPQNIFLFLWLWNAHLSKRLFHGRHKMALLLSLGMGMKVLTYISCLLMNPIFQTNVLSRVGCTSLANKGFSGCWMFSATQVCWAVSCACLSEPIFIFSHLKNFSFYSKDYDVLTFIVLKWVHCTTLLYYLFY